GAQPVSAHRRPAAVRFPTARRGRAGHRGTTPARPRARPRTPRAPTPRWQRVADPRLRRALLAALQREAVTVALAARDGGADAELAPHGLGRLARRRRDDQLDERAAQV